MTNDCRICAGTTHLYGQALLFGVRPIGYFRCQRCGFVQTEHPDWLADAYRTPFTAGDVGFFRRAMEWSFGAAVLVMLRLNPHGQHLDYGTGHGLFVRAMRDIGLDFRGYDAYADCRLCHPWVVTRDELESRRFNLVTALEVVEHLPDPLAVFDRLAPRCDAIFFSTTLLPEPAPRPGTWEYYGPEHGQHVSFFTTASLRVIAARYGWQLSTNGRDLHFLHQRRLPTGLFRLLTARVTSLPLALILRPLKHVVSLTGRDAAELAVAARATH